MVMGQAVAETEVLVIGAGPGGYVAAIRCAQLGFSVTLVDAKGELGGMCLHHGCIPSKALIHAAGLYHEMAHADSMGIHVENPFIDFGKTHAWKQGVVTRLANGISGLCTKHGITVLKAFARFQDDHKVVLEGEGLDVNAIEFRHCIIAVGSAPRALRFAPFGGRVLSSWDALDLQVVPSRLAVIGGGFIGIELGAMFGKVGSAVTVFESSEHILGVVEREQAETVAKRLSDFHVEVRVQTGVDAIQEHEHGVTLRSGSKDEEYDYVLVAIGNVPVTQKLQLDRAGVQVDDHGFITVDAQLRTNVPHIYAVGDVVGGMMLAHKASAQGRVVAEVIAGKKVAFEPQAIPAVIFTDPEIASVGLREQEARARYGDSIKVGSFPFAALGKALAIQQAEGFVKLIADEHGVLLGVHAVGPGVTDYISEAALALELGATVEDLSLTIHPHPTLAESFSEAADVLLGQSVHLYQPK